MDAATFIVYIKTDDIYKDIAKDVETRFDASNCVLDKGKNKKGSLINEKSIRWKSNIKACWIKSKDL